MKSYQEILATVKSKNPGMSHKDAQKTASNIFRDEKIAEENEKNSTESTTSKKGKVASKAALALSKEIESVIVGPRNTYDKNKILTVANSYGDFTLVEAGKDGVNTLVYLKGPVRVPATGFFKIFKA